MVLDPLVVLEGVIDGSERAVAVVHTCIRIQ